MIKRFIHVLLVLVLPLYGKAQEPDIDSLRSKVEISKNDTLSLLLFTTISEFYRETKPDSSYYFGDQLLTLARKLKFKLNEVDAHVQMGYALLNMGNYPRSLQTFLTALAIAEDPKSEENILPEKYLAPNRFNRPATPHIRRLDMLAIVHHYIGILYGNANNYNKGLYHDLRSRQLSEQTGNVAQLSLVYLTLGRVYLSIQNPDSALICERLSYDLALQAGFKKYMGSILLNLGRIYSARGETELASEYFKKSLTASTEQNYLRGVIAGNLLLSDLYRQSDKKDSSLYYANEALAVASPLNSPDLLVRSYTAMAAFYKTTDNRDSTIKYLQLVIKMNDNLFNSKQAQLFQNIDFDARQREQEIKAAEEAYQNRQQKYLLVAGLASFSLIVIFLLRNNAQRQKSNRILQQQKKEIEITLGELKITQKQLIQSEKMALLGELTAGIAHEIQNPLNFVNNFSEVNEELLVEMNDEIEKGNLKEVKSISKNVIENEQKINHHGKRADAIVKGMLQHSRTSSGVKEPANINALTDEYFRLAYHGLRAKDKSFNATMKTEFDETIGSIDIIPQDIGRVILNLITNAFYAVTEKNKLLIEGYEPTVLVSTNKSNGKVEVRVRDNGNGIPSEVLDKIFQPFFTTKPTGKGTGLGLSLSYDIVKAHGGELKVETNQNDGTVFTIQLPVKTNP